MGESAHSCRTRPQVGPTAGVGRTFEQARRDGENQSGRVPPASPTRRETAITTIMVFIMVFLACIFFFLADQAMSRAIAFLFGFGR